MAQIAVPSDIEIAQSAKLKPIGEIAHQAGFTDDEIDCYGRYIAKISREKCLALSSGKRILLFLCGFASLSFKHCTIKPSFGVRSTSRKFMRRKGISWVFFRRGKRIHN